LNRKSYGGDARIDLGELGDLEAVDQLIDVHGLNLIDAGCAGGKASLGLVERGATVLGVEPDPIQAKHNLSQPPVTGLTFQEAGAEALPADDGSADGVFLFRSLHHVPADSMDQALEEADRVLKPNGFLFVAEPALDCSFYALMKPFHDEREVRTLAQAALERTADKRFGETTKYRTVQRPKFPDFETLITQFTGMSFNHITRDMIDCEEVRERFAAARAGDQHVFEQPMLINLYRKSASLR
jgi:SAM-dependent methyltransferase